MKPRAKRATKPRKPKVAKATKQLDLIAVKVPASSSSDTAPARKLLDAIGRRPPPKHKKMRRPGT